MIIYVFSTYLFYLQYCKFHDGDTGEKSGWGGVFKCLNKNINVSIDKCIKSLLIGRVSF